MLLNIFKLPVERFPMRGALLDRRLRQLQVVSALLQLYGRREGRLCGLQERKEAGRLPEKVCLNQTVYSAFSN